MVKLENPPLAQPSSSPTEAAAWPVRTRQIIFLPRYRICHPRSPVVPWDPREDEIIITEHRKHPPTPWGKVSELVTALGICPRSPQACSLRWNRSLKHDDPTTEKPTEPEQTLLEQAVTEVETGMVDKWWIVALRYQELSRGYDAKEFKKGACKKWWEWMARQKAEKAESGE